MSAKSFEDIQVWQNTRGFVKAVYELTSLSKFSRVAINIIKQISNFKKYLRNYLIKEGINKAKLFLLHLIKF